MEGFERTAGPAIPHDDAKMRAYLRVRRTATALLAGMAGIYGAARVYEPHWPVLGFVRAAAEAAMVGGIADWFAVTALFRHPLRIPLPHTAIIPRNKDRIGDNLARFVELNFLTREVISRQLTQVDFTTQFARWLGEPGRSSEIARHAVQIVPGLLEAIDERDVHRFIEAQLAKHAGRIDLQRAVGNVLEALVEDDRHQAVVTEMLQQLAALFHENKPLIRERVRESTAWIWQKLSVDEKVADNLIGIADQTLDELGKDPNHPWRRRFDDAVRRFIEQLKTSPDYLEKWQALRQRWLGHPAVERYLSTLWDDIRATIERDAASTDSVLQARLQAAIERLSTTVLREDAVRDRLDAWAREAMLGIIETQRPGIARLISDTVRQWDAQTVTQKIELEVGRDLQFVRINGTVIGALVGLALHTLSVLLF